MDVQPTVPARLHGVAAARLIPDRAFAKMLPTRPARRRSFRNHTALKGTGMNDEQRKFARQLIHHAIHSATGSLIWRLPTFLLVLLLGVLIWAVFQFNLF